MMVLELYNCGFQLVGGGVPRLIHMSVKGKSRERLVARKRSNGLMGAWRKLECDGEGLLACCNVQVFLLCSQICNALLGQGVGLRIVIISQLVRMYSHESVVRVRNGPLPTETLGRLLA